MGNRQSLDDELIELRLTSKAMLRSAKKCEKSEAAAKVKLKQAIQKGNIEGARIQGQNAIREKNQALNCLRLSSRIDAVASRLETAIRMKMINKSMRGVVKGMGAALKSMDTVRISKTMDNFETQFEDMDVRAGYMENAMSNTTAMSTPQEQVDELIQMVADEAGLEIEGQLDEAGKEASQDLNSRLADLRK